MAQSQHRSFRGRPRQHHDLRRERGYVFGIVVRAPSHDQVRSCATCSVCIPRRYSSAPSCKVELSAPWYVRDQPSVSKTDASRRSLPPTPKRCIKICSLPMASQLRHTRPLRLDSQLCVRSTSIPWFLPSMTSHLVLLGLRSSMVWEPFIRTIP